MNRRPHTYSTTLTEEMTKRTKKTKRNKEKISTGDDNNDEELKNLKDFQENDDQVEIIKPVSHLAPDARKDLHNIALLLFLYFLQGVPLGLTSSLPFILR